MSTSGPDWMTLVARGLPMPGGFAILEENIGDRNERATVEAILWRDAASRWLAKMGRYFCCCTDGMTWQVRKRHGPHGHLVTQDGENLDSLLFAECGDVLTILEEEAKKPPDGCRCGPCRARAMLNQQSR